MKLITTRDRIKDVAASWRRTYGNQAGPYGEDKQVTARALEQLDPMKATADEVCEIIGNGSWTRLACHECGESRDAVVEIGQEPDYESSTAHVCFGCLDKALKLFPSGTFK